MPLSAPRFNPFPGLRPFDLRDRVVFFGRERQTAELLERLGTTRFLAIIGTSGSGKSSLVRAGLLPALHGGLMPRAGSHWQIAILRPGGDPVGNLATALLRTGHFEVAHESFYFLRATLSRSDLGLCDAVQQSQLPPSSNLLVLVDQFEEIFRFRDRSRTVQEEAGGFVRLLLEAARQEAGRIYVVLTMRSDFFGECAQFSGLAEAINEGEYLIPRMKRDQCRLAIEGPVRVGGGAIAERLVQRLLNDMGDDPDQLPILQHALMRTWGRWEQDHQEDEPMDLRHYQDVGTMTSALSIHADEVFHELTPREQVLAEQLFKSLTEAGPDRRGVRRPTRLGELAEIIGAATPEGLSRVINRFRAAGRAFLMPPMAGGPAQAEEPLEGPPGTHEAPEASAWPATPDEAQPTGDLQPETFVDISHESLMRVWTRLRDWVAEEARSAATYRRLAVAAALAQEGESGLWQDPELQLALNWRSKVAPTLAWGRRYHEGFESAMAFLERSHQARTLARRKAMWRRRLVVAALSIVATVFFLLWRYAVAQERRAERQERIARSQARASQAEQRAGEAPHRSQAPRVALLLSKMALELTNMPLSAAVLRKMVFQSRLQNDVLGPHPGHLNAAAYSPDLTQVLAASSTNAYLWDARANQSRLIRELSGHTEPNRVACFSPDGRLALTAGWDGKALLWDTGSWRTVRSLTGHVAPISRASFSRDGRHALTASRDGTSRVWDVPTGAEIAGLPEEPGSSGGVWSAAFHPGGDLVAVGGSGGTVSLWAWRTTNRLARIQAHTKEVLDVEYSANDFLASASGDGTVVVWRSSPSGLEAIRTNTVSNSAVLGVAFGPDESLLAAAGDDHVVTLLDWRTGTTLWLLQHPDSVTSVEFTPTGSHLLTACNDGFARIWETGLRVLPSLPEASQVAWAEVSRGGELLVTGDGSGTVRVWGLPAARSLANLTADLRNAWAAAFHPATNVLVTAGDEGVVRVWETSTWGLLASRTNHWLASNPGRRTRMRHVAFRPAGDYFVTTSYGRVDVWSGQSWDKVSSLTNHTDWVYDAAFSADGRWLATCGDDYRVLVWDARTWSDPRLLEHQANVRCAAFHPRDPARLATGDRSLRLWTWNEPRAEWVADEPVQQYKANLTRLQFTPTGECLLVTNQGGDVEIWDVAARRRIADLSGRAPGQPQRESPVALLLPDGQSLISFREHAIIHESPALAPLEVLLRSVAQRQLRPLTPQELRF